MIRVGFHTLGCKVNQYESEAIAEAFVKRGAEIVPEDTAADVYIINTCTVTNMADRKSRQFIRRMKNQNPDALMVVTGCYAQVSKEELEQMPEVDLIIGNSRKAQIADRVYEILENQTVYSSEAEVLEYRELSEYEEMGIVTSSESGMSRAYIKIQEGCNRFCSYCLIPYARGTVRSRSIEDIMEEAEMLLEKGFHELVLTGINTALYGMEPNFAFERLPGEEEMSGMEAVISRLDAMEGDFRIRLSSLEPTVVDIEHIEKIVRYKKLCHHLHLSLQSGSDSVLNRMNRHYTRDEYFQIVQALRDFDPLYGITTDIIVGFPGETDDDFTDTIDAVKKSNFGRVHIFRYSSRKGTAAEKMTDAVSGATKGVRAGRLEHVALESQKAFNEKNIGTEHTVLVEEHDGDVATGYTGNYIKVYIEDPDRRAKDGAFCRVRLTETMNDGCRAEVV